MAVVGAPSYFTKRSAPKQPQDVTEHNWINLRLPTYGGRYAWEFEKGCRELKVRIEGQLVLNSTGRMHRYYWTAACRRIDYPIRNPGRALRVFQTTSVAA